MSPSVSAGSSVISSQRGWREHNCASSSSPMSFAPRRSLLALALALCPSIARAHVSLRASAPAAGARLATSPTALILWFTARPQLAFCSLQLMAPNGAVALGPLAADSGNALRAAIPGTLTPGEYRVSWQAGSADGHP